MCWLFKKKNIKEYLYFLYMKFNATTHGEKYENINIIQYTVLQITRIKIWP